MRKTLIAAVAIASLPVAACTDMGGGPGYSSRNRDYTMGDNDHIYRDRDGSYYCRKPDGTRGAIIGGLAGGVLGNVIAPDGSKTLGTVLGAVGGAVAGRAVQRGQTRCR